MKKKILVILLIQFLRQKNLLRTIKNRKKKNHSLNQNQNSQVKNKIVMMKKKIMKILQILIPILQTQK